MTVSLNIAQALQSKAARILISILWGLALSLFFKKTCVGKDCVVVTGPPLHEVGDAIYNFGDSGTCHKFKPVLVACDAQARETVCM